VENQRFADISSTLCLISELAFSLYQ